MAKSIRFEKKALRALFEAKLKALSSKRRSEAKEALYQLLDSLTCFATIASFASFGTEIDTSALNEMLAHQKRLLLPKIEGNSLRFFRVTNPGSLVHHPWGMAEPCAEAENVELERDTLLLVPALAFDSQGFRLGRGKGFYDRFLTNTISITCGIAFKEQLCDCLPLEPHDRKVDRLHYF